MQPYLDNNATTPVDPRVATAVERWQTERFGNASSQDHAWGWDAGEAVEDARAAVAGALGVPTGGVTFTSGATEAINTVIRSYVGFDRWSHKLIVTCAAEHDAVLAPCRLLARRTGVRLQILPVDPGGRVDLAKLGTALAGSSGALVVLTAGNNEIGTRNDLESVARVVHDARALFLCDATQAPGKCPIDLGAADVDFAAVSAHKLYGPKGVGALVARSGDLALDPLILGGGQERGLRGGTLNVPGIVGFGEASRLLAGCLEGDVLRMQTLRDRLERAILAEVPATWVNGDRENRLCNTTNIGFRGVDARTLVRDVHDVAVSTRSACSSGRAGPSHVLKAIGLSDEDAYSCVRFSLGRFTTPEEIDYAIEKVVTSAHKLRRAKSVRA